jgi:hypothetical protein
LPRKRAGEQARFRKRLFTAEAADLLGSATDEDMRAAAGELAAAPERLAELLMPYIRRVTRERRDGQPTAE